MSCVNAVGKRIKIDYQSLPWTKDESGGTGGACIQTLFLSNGITGHP